MSGIKFNVQTGSKKLEKRQTPFDRDDDTKRPKLDDEKMIITEIVDSKIQTYFLS